MAMIRLRTPGPSTTTIMIATRMSGSDSMASIARMITLSRPPP
jgi:hypothetical protein